LSYSVLSSVLSSDLLSQICRRSAQESLSVNGTWHRSISNHLA
jgi:hypothetical protein